MSGIENLFGVLQMWDIEAYLPTLSHLILNDTICNTIRTHNDTIFILLLLQTLFLYLARCSDAETLALCLNKINFI